MLSITLRDYQEDSVNSVRQAMGKTKKILCQQPTGAGKTVIAAYMADAAKNKGKRIYFICHRQELIEQTAKTFGKYGIQCGIIWSKAPKLYDLPVQVCSIDTLKNRLEEVPYPDLIIWDECHHIAAAGWARVQEYYKYSFHLGLSATPTRLDGKGLKNHFDILLPGKQTAELMEMGNLSDYSFFAPTTPNTDDLHIKMGDFAKAESEEIMDTNTIHGDIIKHYVKHAIGRRTIVFAVTVAHSKHIAAAFRTAGIMAIHLDGETPKKERQLAAKAFAKGDIDIITNVGLFGEGYDLGAQADMDVSVDCVIDAQPTNSLSWCLQKWGRAFRPKSDGSKAIILDHAGNYTRHGFPDDHRTWSLDGIDKKVQKKEREELALRIRQCPECLAIHHPMPTCPECGYDYKVKPKVLEEVEADLTEIDIKAMRNQQRSEQAQARTAEDLVATGMNSGRARHIIAAREKKDRLRRSLYNLIEGAKAVNINDFNYTQTEISKMKPKELGSVIDEISSILFERSEYSEANIDENSEGQESLL